MVGSVDDLSNATIGFSGTTRPTNFVSAAVSQNLPDTSANTIVSAIVNAIVIGLLYHRWEDPMCTVVKS